MIAPSAPWPARCTLLVMLHLACVLSYMDRVVMSVAIVAIGEEQGWDLSEQGALLSAFFIGYIACMLPWGVLSDRIGAKPVLGWGLFAWSMLTIAMPLAVRFGYAATFAARVLVGCFEAVTFPAVMHFQARAIPLEERGRALGAVFAGSYVGTVVGMGATPILLSRWGWRLVFVYYGAVGLVWCVFFFYVGAATRRHMGGS
jgi:ACS family sodium-dependent inorganic phosphate cotransporter